MTSIKRRFGKTRAVISIGRAALLLPRWRLAKPDGIRKRAAEQAVYRRFARGFVGNIIVAGTPAGTPGTLYVCNHISWLDIPILASVIETDFIAMDDIADWPVVGRLSKRTQTIFVSRTAKLSAQRQIAQIGARLAAGVNLMLFAEGTTSDGATVGPFISSLFAAAQSAAAVQPLCIAYCKRGGEALDDAQMAAIGWTDDNGLMPNAVRVAGMKIEAVVTLLSPAPRGIVGHRRALMAYCHEQISSRYAAVRANPRA